MKNSGVHNGITRGGGFARKQWFNLRGLLNKFQCQFDAVAKSQDVMLDISVSAQTPVNFSGDPQRLNDILKELLTYVMDYFDGGCIVLNVRAIPVRLNEYRLDITLTTSGAGIPCYRFGTIFQPVSATGQSSLYLAKALSVLMRGDLTVENTFGWGTRYCLFFLMKGMDVPWHDHRELEDKAYGRCSC